MSDELSPDKTSQFIAQLRKYSYQFFSIVAVFVFLLVSFISYKFILFPKYDNTNDEIKKAIEIRTESKDLLGRYLLRLKKYQENYDNVSRINKRKVEEFFNYGYDVEILFSQFEVIAKEQGLILSNFSISQDGKAKNKKSNNKTAVKSDKELETIKINASFVGLSYEGLKIFLDFFENALPLINIINLNFSGDNNVVITAETYYLN
ncbi:MAG: hypothetical protein U9Q85_02335 [Patescibacteria group bacterium]|nr:hypothetical protein [Patescibacteria group bacterium]